MLLSTVASTIVLSLTFGKIPTVQVDPWGDNAVRIRWVLDGGTVTPSLPGALEETAPSQTGTGGTNIKVSVGDTGQVELHAGSPPASI